MSITNKISNKLVLSILFSVLAILTLTGCGTDEESSPKILEEPYEQAEFLMGTYVTMRIYDEGKEDALTEAFERVAELDVILSSNDEGSEIDAINQNAGQSPIEVSEDVFPLIEVAEAYSAVPNSGFDYTVGPITNLWRIGFDDARVPEPSEIEAILPLVDYKKAELNADNQTVFLTEADMRIDLGAIAKGYIADEVIKVLEDNGVTTAIVDLGGNIVIMGDSPTRETGGWNVGVQNPNNERGSYIAAINLKNKSIVTSGIYERFIEKNGEQYHHLMDPRTGYPFDNELASVTIISDKSVDGDALSTVVYAFDLEDGLEYVNGLEDVEAVFITKDNDVYTSDGLQDSMSLTDENYNWVNQ